MRGASAAFSGRPADTPHPSPLGDTFSQGEKGKDLPMPLDPERALQAALYAALRGASELVPLLGDPPRVYDEPPPDPIYPFVTLGRAESKPFGGSSDGGEGAEHVLTLTCVSRFGGAEEAKALAGLVRARLHDAVLPLQDHRLVNLRVTYTDVFRAADWRFTYGLVRLRAVTEPTT